MKILKVTQTYFNDLKQRIIKGWNGKSDTRTAKQLAPFGIDSNPVKDVPYIYIKTELDGKEVIVGFIQKDLLAEVGETRLFSTDANGNLQTYIWLKNANNEIHLGGDSNFAVKFNELKTEFNKLKTDFNTLVNLYNSHVHPVAGAVPAAPPTLPSTTPTASQATANTSNIDTAKNEKIKTN